MFVMILYYSLMHVMLDLCNQCACFAKKIIIKNYYFLFINYSILLLIMCGSWECETIISGFILF
jgi:hypothetical protein